MNYSDQELDLIDRYITGKLTIEEKEQFKKKMQDPDFKLEVTKMEKVAEGIKFKALNDLKASLVEEEQLIQNEKRSSLNIKRIFAYAAGIALLLLAAWWITRPPAEADLFAKYFVPQNNSLVVEDKSRPTANLELQVFNNYDNEKYEEALTGFEQLLAQKDNPDFRFFQAMTYLALDKTEEGAIILKNLLNENKSRYFVEAKWFLALSYLDQNNFPLARPLLEELSSVSYYEEKAKEILKDKRFEN